MKRVVLILALTLALSGCGYVERLFGAVTGGGVETCHDDVTYLQFTSSASVKYLPNGQIATCK